jgi:hypothetical protein
MGAAQKPLLAVQCAVAMFAIFRRQMLEIVGQTGFHG